MTQIIIEELNKTLIYDLEVPKGKNKSMLVYVKKASKARDNF